MIIDKKTTKAIKDLQESFPKIKGTIDVAIILHYNRHGNKQSKAEQTQMMKFAKAIKVIMGVKLKK